VSGECRGSDHWKKEIVVYLKGGRGGKTPPHSGRYWKEDKANGEKRHLHERKKKFEGPSEENPTDSLMGGF